MNPIPVIRGLVLFMDPVSLNSDYLGREGGKLTFNEHLLSVSVLGTICSISHSVLTITLEGRK